MKKAMLIILAIIIIAGIGTGVFLADKLRKNNSESVQADEKVSETTTEIQNTKIEYGEFDITEEEYKKDYPSKSEATDTFENGKYYAPIQVESGYGPAGINWGKDGKTVTVEGSPVFGGYTIYKLNEYGEVLTIINYDISYSDQERTDYVKNVIKPSYVYDAKHWLVKSSNDSDADIYEHDEKGNIVKIIHGSSAVETETFTYDENGNIIKFVIEDYYEGMGDGYWNDYDTDDRIVSIRTELNSAGLVVRQWEKYNGEDEENEYEFSYAEVSPAQYNFYNQCLKAQIFSKAHSIT